MSRSFGNGMYKVSLDQSYRVLDNAYRTNDIITSIQTKSKKGQALNKVEIEYCRRNDIAVVYNKNNNSWYLVK
jgi:hypothetical protein